MGNMDVWYARVDVEEILGILLPRDRRAAQAVGEELSRRRAQRPA